MSGKMMVIGLFALLGLAGVLLVLAVPAADEAAPATLARMPRPIDAAALPAPQSEGALLLQRHCIACHVLPDPAQHAAALWPAVLQDMEQRMHSRIMRNAPVPSRAGWRTIEAYLQAHAADAARVAAEMPAAD